MVRRLGKLMQANISQVDLVALVSSLSYLLSARNLEIHDFVQKIILLSSLLVFVPSTLNEVLWLEEKELFGFFLRLGIAPSSVGQPKCVLVSERLQSHVHLPSCRLVKRYDPVFEVTVHVHGSQLHMVWY